MGEHPPRPPGPRHAEGSDRYPLVLVFLFSLFMVFLFRPGFLLDSYAYYDYTRSIIFDGDINFYNERAFSPSSLHFGIRTETGFTNNIFPIGAGALWLPPVYLFHCANRLLEKDRTHEAYPGFSGEYLLVACLTSAIFVGFGLLLLYSFLKYYFSPTHAFLSTVLLFLASPLLPFTFLLPSFSHAISFFAVILFLFLVQRYSGEHYQALLMGLAGGLMVLVRLQNTLFLLFPVLYLFQAKEKKRWAYKKMLLFMIAFFISFSPQIITWKILNGSFFALHSAGEDMSVLHQWADPALFQQLFNLRLGLFTFTPVVLLGTVGLFLWTGGRRRLLISGTFLFLLILYLNSAKADWYGVGGYGARRFISTVPFFAAGFANLLNTIAKRKKWILIPFLGIAVYGCLKNLASVIAFASGALKTETIGLLPPLAAFQKLYLSSLTFSGLTDFLQESFFLGSGLSLAFGMLLLLVFLLTTLLFRAWYAPLPFAKIRPLLIPSLSFSFFFFLSFYLLYTRWDARTVQTVDCISVEKKGKVPENKNKVLLKEKLGRSGTKGKVARRREKAGTVLPLVLRTSARYEGIAQSTHLSPGDMLNLHLHRTIRTDLVTLVLRGNPGPLEDREFLRVFLEPVNGPPLIKTIPSSGPGPSKRETVLLPLPYPVSIQKIKIQNSSADDYADIYGLCVEKQGG